MIEEKDINSWEELIEELECLRSLHGERADKLLYRGQANSKWDLKTTQERTLKQPMNLSSYYRFAYSAKTRLETFTEKNWDVPTPPKYEEWVEKKDTFDYLNFPAYEYLAYLRHHGFPSPFLDWTTSPYIAIFFAFTECLEGSEQVSLHCFLERATIGKIWSSDEPGIHSFGPYAKIHRRHVIQQSQYTICVELDQGYNPIYADHEEVFRREDEKQDILWKFNIPITERFKILKILNQMNINAFSLFGSEDSLVQSISTNEMIKKSLMID